MNRRVLSGCTGRAGGQYGTTCPSQRNRDTLSKAGESASRPALKLHFPHARGAVSSSGVRAIEARVEREPRQRSLHRSPTALNGPFSLSRGRGSRSVPSSLPPNKSVSVKKRV